MPPPVTTITLDGNDISADVKAPAGQPTVRYGRGANFDGTSEVPGYCVVSVVNTSKKFSPYNSGSPIASSLRFGKRMHFSTVYNSVTYHPFDGYLDRIVQDPLSGFAELHFIDLLGLAKLREMPLAFSATRSLRDFRNSILNALGVAVGDRSLGAGGGELWVPFTGADRESAASWLEAINEASGSIHFMRGKSGSHEYVALDRTQLQATAVAETWSDADFTQPFAETLGGLDYTAEGLINRQLVKPTLAELETEVRDIWRSPDAIVVNANEVRVLWAEWNEPADGTAVSYVPVGNAPGVSVSAYFRTARIEITGNPAGSGEVRNLTILGRLTKSYDVSVDPVAEEQDTASQTTYGGVRTGKVVDSELIPSLAAAHGLASWYIYRYKDVRARPPVVMVNRLPSQLQRDIGDRVAITSAALSFSASQFWIRSMETTVEDSGATWRTKYDLEAAPALVDIVMIGGTSAQGVGGTAILGY